MHFLLQLKSNLNVFYQLAGSCVLLLLLLLLVLLVVFLWTAVEAAAAAVSLCCCMLLRPHRWPPAACWFVGLFGCMKTTDGSVCSSTSIKTVRKTHTPTFYHLHTHSWWFLSSGSQNVSKCGFWCQNCSDFNDMPGLIRRIIALMSAGFIVKEFWNQELRHKLELWSKLSSRRKEEKWNNNNPVNATYRRKKSLWD